MDHRGTEEFMKEWNEHWMSAISHRNRNEQQMQGQMYQALIKREGKWMNKLGPSGNVLEMRGQQIVEANRRSE